MVHQIIYYYVWQQQISRRMFSSGLFAVNKNYSIIR